MTWKIIRGAIIGIITGVILGGAAAILISANKIYGGDVLLAGTGGENDTIDRSMAASVIVQNIPDEKSGEETGGGLPMGELSAYEIEQVPEEEMSDYEIEQVLADYGIDETDIQTWFEDGENVAAAGKEAPASLNKALAGTDEAVMLQDKILRFHVKANSNAEEDINLKYEVRDAVLDLLKDKISEAETKEEAQNILYENMAEIERTAAEEIEAAGYDYSVDAGLESRYFPIRQYGDVVLPAGTYDALTITIGKGEGENFWCMLYPAICFTTDSAAVVDSESKEKLKRTLTEEEYKEVFIDTEARDEGRVHISFKFLELFD